jgi:ABC-type branched-subunit amino acid transport system ATPase component
MSQQFCPDIEPFLAVEGVSVQFGGIRALDNVGVSVAEGTLEGLIGPNGAGKTTLFNVISGLQVPQRGQVSIAGRDATGMPPHVRARLGLARTFQRLELFSRLTVFDNLLVAYESRTGGIKSAVDVFDWRKSGSGKRASVQEILELLDLTPVADKLAGSLPMGLGRIVEVARALCTQPRVLLLDEPTAGLNELETDRLARTLSTVVERRRVGILLVEHDVDFVFDVCSRITVLDFGQVIAVGGPGEIRANEAVRVAYLGSESSEERPDSETDGGVPPGAEEVEPAPHVDQSQAAPLPAHVANSAVEQPADQGSTEHPVLSVSDLCAGYGKLSVLREVSLKVDRGQVVALLGPNGAGKTTTLRTIASLISPTRGEVRMDGSIISTQSAHTVARRGLILIPEDDAVFRNLTVRENLEMFSELSGAATSRQEFVDHAISTFSLLGERLNQQAGTLSGGEQRLLALTRGLGPHVRLLMIDEISLGLAPQAVEGLFAQLSILAQAGTTILLVEQYVHEALKLADYVYVLARGQVVHSCLPQEFDPTAIASYSELQSVSGTDQ